MPAFDEEAPKKKLAHELGEDLSKLSLDELAARVEVLKAEIARLEEAATTKRASARRRLVLQAVGPPALGQREPNGPKPEHFGQFWLAH